MTSKPAMPERNNTITFTEEQVIAFQELQALLDWTCTPAPASPTETPSGDNNDVSFSMSIDAGHRGEREIARMSREMFRVLHAVQIVPEPFIHNWFRDTVQVGWMAGQVPDKEVVERYFQKEGMPKDVLDETFEVLLAEGVLVQGPDGRLHATVDFLNTGNYPPVFRYLVRRLTGSFVPPRVASLDSLEALVLGAEDDLARNCEPPFASDMFASPSLGVSDQSDFGLVCEMGVLDFYVHTVCGIRPVHLRGESARIVAALCALKPHDTITDATKMMTRQRKLLVSQHCRSTWSMAANFPMCSPQQMRDMIAEEMALGRCVIPKKGTPVLEWKVNYASYENMDPRLADLVKAKLRSVGV